MDDALRRVLLVDDDLAIRGILTEALIDEGFAVQPAENGRLALEVIESGWLPDIILLDLMMPEMDGWTFLQRRGILEHAREIPVIVISASRDLPREPSQLGVAAVVAKPFDLEALVSIIHAQLGFSGLDPRSGRLQRHSSHEAAGTSNGNGK